MTLTNAGTAPTQTRHTVTGPLAAGFQISHAETGRRLVYPAPVTADVVIDCAEGTVTSGGQDRTGLLTVDEFFTVDAGAVGTFQFSTLGSETSTSPARMTATLSPAYH